MTDGKTPYNVAFSCFIGNLGLLHFLSGKKVSSPSRTGK